MIDRVTNYFPERSNHFTEKNSKFNTNTSDLIENLIIFNTTIHTVKDLINFNRL